MRPLNGWISDRFKLSVLAKKSAARASALLAVKLLGLASRAGLSRIVGAGGIGLYQMAYSFYGFLLTLTGGFSTTLALVTAQKPAQGWRYFKLLSVWGLLVYGTVSLAVCRHADKLAGLLGNPDLTYALKSLAIALLVVPFLGFVRAYLQGLNRIGTIAVSEVVEQVLRVSALFLILTPLVSQGIEVAVGKGLLGTLLGALGAFALLTICLAAARTDAPPPVLEETHGITVAWFVKSSLAISATRVVLTASELIDAVLIPNRLQAGGLSPSQSTALYGVVYGMAAIVAYAPTLISAALSHTVSVHIAEEWQAGRHSNVQVLTTKVLRVCFLWGTASSLFLFFYSNELSALLFHTNEAAVAMRLLSPIPLLVGLREMSTSIRWIQDDKKRPLVSTALGLAFSLLIQVTLVPVPGFGYTGACLSILALEVTACLGNLLGLLKWRAATREGSVLGTGDFAFVFILAAFLGGATLASESNLLSFFGVAGVYFSAVLLFIYLRRAH